MPADADLMKRPRLLLADHRATRAGISIALEGDAEVCAEAGDASQAIAAAQREQPDVCIVSLELPGGGAAAVDRICEVSPRSAVIVLASSPDIDDLLDVLRAGAVGYLPGSIEPAALRRVVRAVAAGEAAVPRTMVRELARELHSTADLEGQLTRREAQVLGMLRRGRSTSAIAERLAISPVTVRRHISALMQKFGVHDRADLCS